MNLCLKLAKKTLIFSSTSQRISTKLYECVTTGTRERLHKCFYLSGKNTNPRNEKRAKMMGENVLGAVNSFQGSSHLFMEVK